MGAPKKQRTIDRLELARLLKKQDHSTRGLFGHGIADVSRGTYHAIKTKGAGTEKKLAAIAKAMGLEGTAAFVAVGIDGAKVRERRRDKGWAEKDLAERCRSGQGELRVAITAETITGIEKGKLPPPDGSHELCRRLAAVLGYSFEDLVYDPSSARPNQSVTELLGPLSELWVRHLFTRKTGGMGPALRNSSWSQPWATAQALVGALQVPGVVARHGMEVRHSLDYLARWRHPSGCPVEKLAPEDEQGWALREDEVKPVPVTEITCWVLLAYTCAVRTGALGDNEAMAYLASEVKALLPRQYSFPNKRDPVGGFCPTVQVCNVNQRTYSTVMVLWVLAEVLPMVRDELEKRRKWDSAWAALRRGIEWLVATYDREFGWVPNPYGGKRTHYPGLTAQVLFVLTLILQSGLGIKLPVGYLSALHDFLRQAGEFSRVWEFRDPAGDVSILPGDVWVAGNPYRLEGSEFLWAPWTLALVGLLIRSGYPGTKRMQEAMQEHLAALRDRIAMTTHKALSTAAANHFGAHEIGEALFGVSWLSPGGAKHAIRPVTP